MSEVNRWVVCLGAVVFVAGGCATQEVEKIPDPPSLAGLVDEFQEPSAPLDEGSLAEVVATLFETVDTVTSSNTLGPLIDALGGFGGAGEETNTSALVVGGGLETVLHPVDVGGEVVEGDGFVRVSRICMGWGETPPAVNKKQNGVIDLTGVFADTGFHPVIWGDAKNCRYQSGLRELEIDGAVSIHTGDMLAGGEEPILDLVIEFDGLVEIDGVPSDGDLGLRILEAQTEINLQVEQGNLVYFNSPLEQGFRAANGEWTCDFEARQCTNDEGTTIGF